MKRELLQALETCRDGKCPCAVVTDIRSGAQTLVEPASARGDLTLSEAQLETVRDQILSDQSGMAGENLFVRVYGPPVRMVLVGAVHIAQALAPMAKLAGFEVIVIDPREAFVRAGNLAEISAIVEWPDDAMLKVKPDARTAVVTLTHDPKLDDPALTAALRSRAFYIGALGSKKTHAKRLERLKEAGFGESDFARIHGPVGLNIKAHSPAEIAVSILAQVVQSLRADGGRPASGKGAPSAGAAK